MAPTNSSAAKKAPAKQASLFSFFAKKDNKAVSTPESVQAPGASASSSAAPEPIRTGSSGAAITPGLPSLSPESAQQGSSGPAAKGVKSYGAEVVGRRVSIFWPEDDEYYSGTVSDYSNEDGKHTVRYDDGDAERVLLANETLRWEEGKGPVTQSAPSAGQAIKAPAEDDDDEEEDEGPSARRKRRSVVLDDEESECEMDLDNLTATPSVAVQKVPQQQGGLKRKEEATPSESRETGSSVSSSGKRTR
jgi:hypothetical protein